MAKRGATLFGVVQEIPAASNTVKASGNPSLMANPPLRGREITKRLERGTKAVYPFRIEFKPLTAGESCRKEYTSTRNGNIEKEAESKT
ncbi:MAG: hypothetical protein QME66_11135 [Candidatus Eisenbacteria bacterium]|nr:hypothetical protein [Candidatus Eisenbacteria bacterium]